VVGVARQVGEQTGNMARHGVALSKLPLSVAAATISRACSSGLNAISIAATQIASGCAEIAIAGGVESITGLERGTPAKFSDQPWLMEHLPSIYMPMGNTAEVVARRYKVTREMQDEYSVQSQQRYAAAVQAETGVEITARISISGESFLTPPGAFSALVASAVQAETGRLPEPSTSGGTSDARFVKDHCPVVEFGLVGRTMHQVDERVEVAQIHQLKAIYGRILKDYFA
jgi:hypothetical protein